MTSFAGGSSSAADDSWGADDESMLHSSHTSNGNGSSGAAAAAAAAAAGNAKLQAAWQQLQQQRPDVFSNLDERHVEFIAKQSRDDQVKVLQQLLELNNNLTQGGREVVVKRMTNVIAAWLRINKQVISPKLAAALQAFTDHHPQVIPFIDDSLLSRLGALPVPQALTAVEALEEADFGPRWESHCKNPSAWLMGVVSRALREGGYSS